MSLNLINCGATTVKVAPSPATSGVTMELNAVTMPTRPCLATIFPSTEEPTQANSEIVEITATTGAKVEAMIRAVEGPMTARAIKVGDKVVFSVTAAQLAGIAARAEAFTPTTLKTGAYNAAPGDYIPVDISAGSVAIKLPTKPADKVRIGVKIIAVNATPGATTCTINCGGETDVFNVAAGNKALTLSAKFQSAVLQYQASTSLWYVQATDTPLNEPLGAALLGTDGTIGGPAGSGLSPTIVTGALKSFGEASGNITPNLNEGRVFTVTATGAITIKKPTNWPAGVTYADIVIKQDATGGRVVTFEGIGWLGGEPVLSTAPNALNVVPIVSYDGGTTWFGIGPAQGREGPQGREGFSPGKGLLPNAVPLYLEPGVGTTENRVAVAESERRGQMTNTLTLTSGTPIAAAFWVPAKKLITGIGFLVTALEATPANRTHLWVALLNSRFEKLKVSPDYTSVANTPLVASRLRALKLASTYETPEDEVLYALVCEVMSSTNPITIQTREGNQALNSEIEPLLGFLGNTGQTTPAALQATVTPTSTKHIPYIVLV